MCGSPAEHAAITSSLCEANANVLMDLEALWGLIPGPDVPLPGNRLSIKHHVVTKLGNQNVFTHVSQFARLKPGVTNMHKKHFPHIVWT